MCVDIPNEEGACMKYFIQLSKDGMFVPLEVFEVTEKFHKEIVESVYDQMKKNKARLV